MAGSRQGFSGTPDSRPSMFEKEKNGAWGPDVCLADLRAVWSYTGVNGVKGTAKQRVCVFGDMLQVAGPQVSL